MQDKITAVEQKVDGLAANIASLALKDKEKSDRKISLLKTLIICFAVVLCVGVYFAADVIKHAVDRNYDYLQGVVVETETETETETISVETNTDGGGNANAFYGNNNTVIGGDANGESKNNGN